MTLTDQMSQPEEATYGSSMCRERERENPYSLEGHATNSYENECVLEDIQKFSRDTCKTSEATINRSQGTTYTYSPPTNKREMITKSPLSEYFQSSSILPSVKSDTDAANCPHLFLPRSDATEVNEEIYGEISTVGSDILNLNIGKTVSDSAAMTTQDSASVCKQTPLDQSCSALHGFHSQSASPFQIQTSSLRKEGEKDELICPSTRLKNSEEFSSHSKRGPMCFDNSKVENRTDPSPLVKVRPVCVVSPIARATSDKITSRTTRSTAEVLPSHRVGRTSSDTITSSARSSFSPMPSIVAISSISRNFQAAASNHLPQLAACQLPSEVISSETNQSASSACQQEDVVELSEFSQENLRRCFMIPNGDSIKVEKDLLKERCSYYYGKMSNDEAKQVLRDQRVGSFLLRDSADSRYLYALSLRTPRGTTSVRIGQCVGCDNVGGVDKICKQCTAVRKWCDFNSSSTQVEGESCNVDSGYSDKTSHCNDSSSISNSWENIESSEAATALTEIVQSNLLVSNTHNSNTFVVSTPAIHQAAYESHTLIKPVSSTCSRTSLPRSMVRLDCESNQQTRMPHFPDVIALVDYCKALSAEDDVRRTRKNRCMFIEKDGRMDTPVLLKEPICRPTDS